MLGPNRIVLASFGGDGRVAWGDMGAPNHLKLGLCLLWASLALTGGCGDNTPASRAPRDAGPSDAPVGDGPTEGAAPPSDTPSGDGAADGGDAFDAAPGDGASRDGVDAGDVLAPPEAPDAEVAPSLDARDASDGDLPDASVATDVPGDPQTDAPRET